MNSPVPTTPVAAAPATSAPMSVDTPPSAVSPKATQPPAETQFKPTDQAVLEYLSKRGLTNAVLELKKTLEKESNAATETKTPKELLQEEDAITRNQRTLLSKSTGGGYGYDLDAAWPVIQWGVPDTTAAGQDPQEATIGVEEARAYLNAFTSLQLWVLSLPDEDGMQVIDNPIKRAEAIVKGKNPSLESVIKELTNPNLSAKTEGSSQIKYNLPPSSKAELLAVTFALYVHTYCELLEVGMESTAHSLRDAFKPVYAPLYEVELRDLYQCEKTEDIMILNSNNSQHMENLANLKSILVQVASYKLRREELNAQTTVNGGSMDPQQKAAKEQKIQEYDRNIGILTEKYNEHSKRASAAYEKMHDLPFLRRARAVRWQLTMATSTYGLLSSFFRTKDDAVLAMSCLLQGKCEIHVEHRDPLPFTPACVLDERVDGEPSVLEINNSSVNWAVPLPRQEDETVTEKLPFPPFYLDEEYDDENKAEWDKKIVQFNRSLLINGFRRLEAIERKRNYEVLPPAAKKKIKEGKLDEVSAREITANPLDPSILLTTLSSKITGPLIRPKPWGGAAKTSSLTDLSAIWEEPGIGLTCAKLCPPDGRRVAVGCDDAAIRIWDVMKTNGGEPIEVLLGHKNGFPVFDVDWNRDGRTLLSAGGDGSIRLWDTMAVGPFGEVTQTMTKGPNATSAPNENTNATPEITDTDPMSVPGLHPEKSRYESGAALAVYRGHASSVPIWSVAFAPCGYYFASAASDATARLWSTDRPVPVRLFTGHTTGNVNCVSWHPNCNYIITGSDDKTARLWDVQSGRTVRLLSGCSLGVNAVKISPGGQYAAGSDYAGIVHLWDLGSGKKVTEFRPLQSKSTNEKALVHTLAFSACGSALAAGGDDCQVRIWDVRTDSLAKKPIVEKPTKSFPTRRTMLMDMCFTKRNLLLSVGKVITPTPLASGSIG